MRDRTARVPSAPSGKAFASPVCRQRGESYADSENTFALMFETPNQPSHTSQIPSRSHSNSVGLPSEAVPWRAALNLLNSVFRWRRIRRPGGTHPRESVSLQDRPASRQCINSKIANRIESPGMLDSGCEERAIDPAAAELRKDASAPKPGKLAPLRNGYATKSNRFFVRVSDERTITLESTL